jgi:hypothetical protein
MVDWIDNYKALAFPGAVGGGPAAGDTLVLTVTAAGDPTATNPVKAAADLAAYFAEDADDKARHERFSDIVQYFQQYAQAVSIASDGDQAITLKYEQDGLWADSTVGDPQFMTKTRRSNAYELAQAYVGSDAHGVTAITVTLNGVAQNS